jgi:cytochrome c
MKKILKVLLLSVTGVLLISVITTILVLWAMDMLNKKGIQEALDFVQNNPPATIWETVIMDLGFYGDAEADPSYGRRLVPGRGHAPWVIRSNLDERPRVLNFALAPGLWAAYQTESASLYQVWRGGILFEGSVYDYVAGPQPTSTGKWFLRSENTTEWKLRQGGRTLPTRVRYLGHYYSPDRTTAGFEFLLQAGDLQAHLRERPDVTTADGETVFQRHVHVESDTADLQVIQGVVSGDDLVLAPGDNLLSTPLSNPTLIPERGDPLANLDGGDVDVGEQVIANSDCLGCHAETHRVVGPSFARIAQKFRGKAQAEPIEALTDSILDGSVGNWGWLSWTTACS